MLSPRSTISSSSPTRVVEGFLHGLHRSPYVGFSVEFASHREYLPGDDLRHLNWKLYARNDKLYVKQYDAETNLDCHLVVDMSGSMETASTGVSKEAICDDAFGRDRPPGPQAARRRRAHSFRRRSARPLETSGQNQTARRHPHRARRLDRQDAAATAAVLHEVAELMPRRGLVVLVSDLFFPAEDDLLGSRPFPASTGMT